MDLGAGAWFGLGGVLGAVIASAIYVFADRRHAVVCYRHDCPLQAWKQPQPAEQVERPLTTSELHDALLTDDYTTSEFVRRSETDFDAEGGYRNRVNGDSQRGSD